MTIRIRARAVVVVLSLIAAACGGGQTTDAASVEASGDGAGSVSAGVSGVPAALDFLGDLTRPSGARMTTAMGDAGGLVALDGGASIVVVSGAFSKTTELTTQVVDVDFTTVLGDAAPWSRAYVVSTVDDVSLGAPVTIEIPRPAAELRAIQIIDGEIVPAEVVGDQTVAQIEIPHFSEVVTLVLNTWGEQAAEAARVEVDRLSQADGPADDTPANFLGTCLGALLGLWGGYSDDGVDEFYSQLSFSLCTSALIRRSAPDGKYVSTACVGDRISGGLDFQPAVDACAGLDGDNADDTSVEVADVVEDTPVPESDSPESGIFSGQAADSAIASSAKASGGYDSLIFDASVELDQAELTVTYSYFTWHRGGEDGGPGGDQNCGSTVQNTASGIGQTGSPTNIRLTIVSSEVVSSTGALCDEDDAERWLKAPGDPGGQFNGQLNGLGLDGEYNGPFGSSPMALRGEPLE